MQYSSIVRRVMNEVKSHHKALEIRRFELM